VNSLKIVKVLVCCLLVFPLVGTVPVSGPIDQKTVHGASGRDPQEDQSIRRTAASACLHEIRKVTRAARSRPSESARQWEPAGTYPLFSRYPGLSSIAPNSTTVPPGPTRAWGLTGAHPAIGSNWAAPDETGARGGALYRNLSAARGGAPAVALRAAPWEPIRSGRWRALPTFRGAYFMVVSQ